MSRPEDNPADDRQPTKEEWDEAMTSTDKSARKFRNKPVKPVEIEAMRLTHANLSDVVAWCNGRDNGAPTDFGVVRSISVPASTGINLAWIGDWIIKSSVGEFSPCRPDIFAATYEEVE